jgi:hypothetical protein
MADNTIVEWLVLVFRFRTEGTAEKGSDGSPVCGTKPPFDAAITYICCAGLSRPSNPVLIRQKERVECLVDRRFCPSLFGQPSGST